MTWLVRTFVLALLAATPALAGCNPYASICSEAMDCEGGNDADYEACVIKYQKNTDVAALYECDRAWDNYITCYSEQARCSSDFWTDNGNCSNAWNDYSTCLK